LDIWTALAAVFHQKVRYWPIEAQASIGRRHVKTLMQRMGIEALYRRPRTTKPEPGHKILLRGAAITRPNQVWAMDITYIPMARGFSNPAGPPGEGVRRCWAGFAEPDAGMKTFGAVSGSRRKSADERY
jgi:transposase InsO family protein